MTKSHLPGHDLMLEYVVRETARGLAVLAVAVTDDGLHFETWYGEPPLDNTDKIFVAAKQALTVSTLDLQRSDEIAVLSGSSGDRGDARRSTARQLRVLVQATALAYATERSLVLATISTVDYHTVVLGLLRRQLEWSRDQERLVLEIDREWTRRWHNQRHVDRLQRVETTQKER